MPDVSVRTGDDRSGAEKASSACLARGTTKSSRPAARGRPYGYRRVVWWLGRKQVLVLNGKRGCS
jgi:hypothetical protein